MRFDLKTPPKKPLRQIAKPAKKVEVREHRVSWWTACAKPDQREEFSNAARARNVDMRSDPVWSRPEKLGQVGQL